MSPQMHGADEHDTSEHDTDEHVVVQQHRAVPHNSTDDQNDTEHHAQAQPQNVALPASPASFVTAAEPSLLAANHAKRDNNRGWGYFSQSRKAATKEEPASAPATAPAPDPMPAAASVTASTSTSVTATENSQIHTSDVPNLPAAITLSSPSPPPPPPPPANQTLAHVRPKAVPRSQWVPEKQGQGFLSPEARPSRPKQPRSQQGSSHPGVSNEVVGAVIGPPPLKHITELHGNPLRTLNQGFPNGSPVGTRHIPFEVKNSANIPGTPLINRKLLRRGKAKRGVRKLINRVRRGLCKKRFLSLLLGKDMAGVVADLLKRRDAADVAKAAGDGLAAAGSVAVTAGTLSSGKTVKPFPGPAVGSNTHWSG